MLFHLLPSRLNLVSACFACALLSIVTAAFVFHQPAHGAGNETQVNNMTTKYMASWIGADRCRRDTVEDSLTIPGANIARLLDYSDADYHAEIVYHFYYCWVGWNASEANRQMETELKAQGIQWTASNQNTFFVTIGLRRDIHGNPKDIVHRFFFDTDAIKNYFPTTYEAISSGSPGDNPGGDSSSGPTAASTSSDGDVEYEDTCDTHLGEWAIVVCPAVDFIGTLVDELWDAIIESMSWKII